MKKMSRESADLLVIVILGGIIVYATIQGFRQLTVLGIAVYMLYFLVQIVADVILISRQKKQGREKPKVRNLFIDAFFFIHAAMILSRCFMTWS